MSVQTTIITLLIDNMKKNYLRQPSHRHSFSMSCHTYLLTALLLTGCAQSSSYKNSALSPDQRADLLLKELTLEEKVSLMMDSSQPVERLDIKPYNWWNEALHGVARAGLATVFPQPIGMAASFDPDLLEQVFTAVSDEARAKNTRYAAEGEYQRYQGLTFWTPTVNIFRDPRFYDIFICLLLFMCLLDRQ